MNVHELYHLKYFQHIANCVKLVIALSLPVPGDPMGQESFQCCECGGTFDVDWVEGVVWFIPQE